VVGVTFPLWLFADPTITGGTIPASPRPRSGRALPGRIELSDDWDSPETNAQIAADFGMSE
jgi:hypothetical protein